MRSDKAPTDNVPPSPIRATIEMLTPSFGRISIENEPCDVSAELGDEQPKPLPFGDEEMVDATAAGLDEGVGLGQHLSETFVRLGDTFGQMREAVSQGDEPALRSLQLNAIKLHGRIEWLSERVACEVCALNSTANYLALPGLEATE